jgi:hypothetical protein
MILSRLTNYLQHHSRISLYDLALHLDSTPAALQGMLDRLERKGRVRRLLMNPSCGKTCCHCCHCDASVLTFYEWIFPPDEDPIHRDANVQS